MSGRGDNRLLRQVTATAVVLLLVLVLMISPVAGVISPLGTSGQIGDSQIAHSADDTPTKAGSGTPTDDDGDENRSGTATPVSTPTDDGEDEEPPDGDSENESSEEDQKNASKEPSKDDDVVVQFVSPLATDLRSINLNQTRTGAIDTGDPESSTFRGYHEPVNFSASAGQTVTIDMRSDGDTYLYLLDPTGSIIAQNDDAGGSLNSSITHTLPVTGNYTIIATSFSSSATFSYTLSVQVPAVVDLRSIDFNQTRAGTVENADPQNSTFRGHYEPVNFSGTAGQDVEIDMRSSGDTYLFLLAPNGTILAQDDDSGHGSNSSIPLITLPATGNYTIIATSDSSTTTFEYTLTLRTAPDLRSMRIGQTRTGTVDTGDPQNSTFRGHYEPVNFSGTAGETLNIDMGSDGDTYLYLLDPNGTIIAQDDDGGSGSNSSLSLVTLPVTGNYTIIATSDSSTATFIYTLSIEAPPDLRSIGLNESKAGTVDAGDPESSSFDGYYEPVNFSGTAGQTVRIRMQSLGDTYLYLLDPNGSVIAQDDASGSGGASQILHTFSITGNYTIIAASDFSSSTFEYTLSVGVPEVVDLRSIDFNETKSGTIENADPQSSSFRGYHEPVNFSGTADQTVTIRMQSIGDTYLYLLDPNGTVIAQDDDGGNGLNSSLIHTLPATGNYTIIATSWSSTATFEYTLSLGTPAVADIRSIPADETKAGTIENADPQNTTFDGYYEPVNFSGIAGQTVKIDMRSAGDTYLFLQAPNGSIIAEDDAGGSGSNSTIILTLPDTGRYTIIASSDFSNALFEYTLTVTTFEDLSTIDVGVVLTHFEHNNSDPFVTELQERGAQVEFIDSTLDRSLLNQFDVIVIGESGSNSSWTASELRALEGWVKDGGGLLLHGDGHPLVVRELADSFGIGITGTDASYGDTSSIADHPATSGVFRADIDFPGVQLTITNTSRAEPLVWDADGEPNIAAAETRGRIVVLGGDYLEYSEYFRDDNRHLTNKVFDWLLVLNFANVTDVNASAFPTVRTTVSVNTTAGRNGSLTMSNFTIFEDGKGKAVQSVTFDNSTETWTVEYNTSDTSRDGSVRQVDVTVDDPAGVDGAEGTYVAPTLEDAVNVTRVNASEFPTVRATVTVNTTAGLTGNLTSNNFSVTEDGTTQTIQTVTFNSTNKVWMVEYDTSNAVEDGTLRNVTVTVDAPAGVDNDTGNYHADYVAISGIDPTEFPTVRAFLNIHTPAGKSGNLSESNFTLYEDGVQQSISSVNFTGNETNTTVDILVVFDGSGSMSGEIDIMRDGIQNISRQLDSSGRDARFAVVTFTDSHESFHPAGENWAYWQNFTRNVTEFERALDNITTGGGIENNYDAISGGLELGFRPSAQKVVIDITDEPHDPTDSTVDQAQIADELRGAGVTYIAISPDFGNVDTLVDESGVAIQTHDSPEYDKAVLAKNVSGQWYDISSVDFNNILENVTGSLTTTWIVEYETTNPERDGTIRNVTVTVDDPDRRSSSAQGRYVPPSLKERLNITAVDVDSFPSVIAAIQVNTSDGRNGNLTKRNFTVKEEGIDRSIRNLSFDNASEIWLIEYNTTNPTLDGSARNLSITVNESTGVGTATTRYVAPSLCRVIDQPGKYVLNQSITSGKAGACIEITSSDVVFDGQGFTINVTGSGQAVNISAEDSISNVTVKNVSVDGGADAIGIHARNDSATVTNISIANNRLSNATNGLVATVGGTNATVDLEIVDTYIAGVTGDGINVDASGDQADVRLVINRSYVDAGSRGIGYLIAEGTDTRVDISISGSLISSSAGEAIGTIDANFGNQTVDVTIVGNELQGYYEAIDIIDVDQSETEANISIVRNNITSTLRDGIRLIDADHNDQTLDLRIAKNRFLVDDEGIQTIDTHGDRSRLDISITNNSIDAGLEAIQDIYAYGSDSTVDIDVSYNAIIAGSEGLEDLIVYGARSRVNLTVDHNAIDAYEGVNGIWASGSDSIVDIVVAENELSVSADGIESIDLDGSNQTVDIRIQRNNITGFSTYGINFDDVQILDANQFDVRVERNRIESHDSWSVGVRIDPDSGSSGPAGALQVDFNEIRTGDTAVRVDFGPVRGIEVHHNILAADQFGVENLNTTAGTYVNATENFWNASDGPGSVGPYEDPVTGTLANGSGSRITNATRNVSNVHFDPYLSAPADSIADELTLIRVNNSTFPTVQIVMSVNTTAGRNGNLSPSNFTIDEEGVSRPIQSVTFDDTNETWQITFNSSNPSRDGSIREVTVTVSESAGVGSVDGEYVAPTLRDTLNVSRLQSGTFPTIRVFLTVNTTAGQNGNLSKSNFSIIENGVGQSIDSLRFNDSNTTWIIEYDTSNTGRDGSLRNVSVILDVSAGIDREALQYTADYVAVTGVDPTRFPTVQTFLNVHTAAGRNGNLTKSNFTVFEDGVQQSVRAVNFTGNGTNTSVDILVVFDRTGSMDDEIAEMRDGVRNMSQQLAASGRDVRFALISFSDCDDTLHPNGEFWTYRQNFTRNVTAFEQALGNLSTCGGTENNYDAVSGGLALDFRPSAQKVVLDITDEDNDLDDVSQSEVADELRAVGVTYVAVTPDFGTISSLQDEDGTEQVEAAVTKESDKRVLAENVSGQWYDISAVDFNNILENVTESLSATWIVEYETSNRAADGTIRNVTVVVDDPERRPTRDAGQYLAPLFEIRQVHGFTSSDGLNTSKQVGIRATRNLSLDNGTAYEFQLVNEDTGDTGTLVLNGSFHVEAGTHLVLMTYQGDGDARADPELWPAGQSPPLPADVVNGSIPAASGLTNFSVSLVNASTGAQIDNTSTAPAVIGYTGGLEQNSTTGAVRLSMPRDVLPRSAAASVTLSRNGSAVSFPMHYDSGPDEFVAVIDAGDFTHGDYSWRTRFRSNGTVVLQVASHFSAKGNVTLGSPCSPLAPDLPAPADPNGDGAFEDLNGNGELDFDDIVTMFQHLSNAEVACQDFNGNGRIDFDDIVTLFEDV